MELPITAKVSKTVDNRWVLEKEDDTDKVPIEGVVLADRDAKMMGEVFEGVPEFKVQTDKENGDDKESVQNIATETYSTDELIDTSNKKKHYYY